MRQQKPVFNEAFHNFADTLLAKFQNNENPTLRLSREQLIGVARDFGFYPLNSVLTRSLREIMGEKGYKIQIGAQWVFISRKAVTNVDPEQWPALIENICKCLDKRWMESGEKHIRLTPAQFRNVATIWPDDNPQFNERCVEAMANIGYTLTFRVNYIDVRPKGTESKPGKKPRDLHKQEPARIRVMNGRQFLPIALKGRRVGWRQGFSHALLINAQLPMGQQAALTNSVLMVPDAVVDCNGAVLTNVALFNGDVLLVNEAALLQVKGGSLLDAQTGHQHALAIHAIPLQKDSSNA
uniref:Uncharacterized protein n=1 Tax=Pseudomonas phage HRDY3 TaxID=3236930 RepID=A0AB39CEN4_9VIRU